MKEKWSLPNLRCHLVPRWSEEITKHVRRFEPGSSRIESEALLPDPTFSDFFVYFGLVRINLSYLQREVRLYRDSELDKMTIFVSGAAVQRCTTNVSRQRWARAILTPAHLSLQCIGAVSLCPQLIWGLTHVTATLKCRPSVRIWVPLSVKSLKRIRRRRRWTSLWLLPLVRKRPCYSATSLLNLTAEVHFLSSLFLHFIESQVTTRLTSDVQKCIYGLSDGAVSNTANIVSNDKMING